MKGDLKKKGKFDLFETTENHQILKLDDKKFFAIIEGQKGDIIVHSDSDHKKKKSISKGKYYYSYFDDDPEFNDIPHLFMEDGNKFREFILPEGFPTGKDNKKKLIRTKEKLSKKKVDEHVQGNENKGNKKRSTKKEINLENKTKAELYEIAKKKRLEGRSKMNKKDLIKNLEKK